MCKTYLAYDADPYDETNQFIPERTNTCHTQNSS